MKRELQEDPRRRARMIVTILRRQAKQEIGEHLLAMAVIERAVIDLSDFARSGFAQYIAPVRQRKNANDAIDFIAGGCEPYASSIGLDSDFIIETVNKVFEGEQYGLIDRARNRLTNERAYSDCA